MEGTRKWEEITVHISQEHIAVSCADGMNSVSERKLANLSTQVTGVFPKTKETSIGRYREAWEVATTREGTRST